MRTVFADSGYWIALLNPRDELHEQAEAVAGQLTPFRIVTTEMVLAEVLSFATGAGEYIRGLAAKRTKDCIADPRVDVVPQTSDQFRAALDLYSRRLDKQWSPTDCASFLLMEEMNIREALAHDHNFVQAGFIALLRSSSVPS